MSGDTPLCSTLSPAELDATFYFSGYASPRTRPSPQAQAAWDEAKEVCIECPIMLRCRAEHVGEEHGVWGGTDPHERYRLRSNNQRRLLNMAPQERAALAARLYAKAHRADATAWAEGFSPATVRRLIKEHRATLAAAPAVARPEVADVVPLPSQRPVWPQAHPTMGDAWVWWYGRAYGAHYMAETADGAWLRFRFRGPNETPVIRWFKTDEVDMRVALTPVIQEWAQQRKRSVT